MKTLLKRVGATTGITALAAGVLLAVGVAAPAQASIGAPSIATTPQGTTSVPVTAGKARGSGLWGYAGDIKTRANDTVYSYGVAVSPTDESVWVTDSAKVIFNFPTGNSRVQRHALAPSADWSVGQYGQNGTYGAVATGDNAGLGANYAKLADSQVWDGTTMTSGKFGGARGIAVTNTGTAWAIDSDGMGSWLTNAKKIVRMITPTGTEAGALGKATWPSGTGWTNRNDPESFDYAVGVARMNNGDMIVTAQTPELLKQYKPDGTFVRNIYLNQPAGTAYATDPGYRSPYAVAVDPTDGTILAGYIDPGAGNSTFIQRIDPNNCTTEVAGNPTGAMRDRCAVLKTIGVGTLAPGNGSSSSGVATFAIQVEPRTGDIYVGQRTGLLSVFAADGTPKGSFSAYGSGTANGQVSTVRGIAFDKRGFMYLTVAEGLSATRVMIFARTPDAITGLTAGYTSTSKTAAALTWDALPAGVTADAQSPVRDYVVEQSTDNGATWAVAPAAASTGNSRTVTGLDPAKTYQFRVSAWNEAGNGDWMTATVAPPVTHPSISVVKKGNGTEAASSAAAVQVDAGATVQFTYVVTNTGDSPVDITKLTDSKLGAITAPSGFSGTLGVNASVTFTASGPVAAGAYHNAVSVEWNESGSTTAQTPATDDWYGFGVTRGLTIAKTGNGVVATDAANPVNVAAGANVVFNYTVTNTGNVPVTGLTLNDSKLGTITPPAGFTGELAANGGSVTFSASGPVAAGAYMNTATASGTAAGTAQTAETAWHGFGVTQALSVVKTGNGVATDSANSALHVQAGSTVAFSYTVTNGGNTDVTITKVTDSVLGDLTAPSGFSGVLGAGKSVTYTANGPVAAGAYHNVVTVTGTPAGGSAALTATDDWFGFGDPKVIPTTPIEPTKPIKPTTPTLPSTGQDNTIAVGGLIGGALALIGGLVLVARRRSRQHA